MPDEFVKLDAKIMQRINEMREELNEILPEGVQVLIDIRTEKGKGLKISN